MAGTRNRAARRTGTEDVVRSRRDHQASGGVMSASAIRPDGEKTSRLGSISHAWRALRHRNFKLFFFGQGISVIGTWMTKLATSWLVYRMTHSALLLGVVSFAGQFVSFALGPI